jgi:succinoglycan biosynthesis transport protein ExoP
VDLRTYFAILWRRKWVIAITTAATLAVVVIGTLMMTPMYTASTTLRVLTAASGPLDSPYYNLQYADRLMNTYSELAASDPVMEELAQKLGLNTLPQIEVEIIPNSELMDIVVEDADPILAKEVANALAGILVAQNEELYSGGSKTGQDLLSGQLAQIEEELGEAQREYEALVVQSSEDPERVEALRRSIELKRQIYAALLQQYEEVRISDALSIVVPAATPQSPSRPRKVLNIALGCMVGVMGGVGLAFLFEHLDTRLHTVEQIEEATALPALGRIPHTRKGPHNIFLDGSSPQREAYRHLRTSLYAAAQGGALKTLLVTSAEPHEGKSTIVTNLAVAMAQAGRRVLAVDGDLRRPTLHTNFHLSNRIGLTSVLEGKLSLQEAVQDTEISGVSVLTSGPLLSNPAELLGSRQMRALLEEMPQHFDMVLVDTPALLPVTDAAVVAPMADGVLLVVECAHAGREDVQSACRELTDIGATLIGLVVNRADVTPGHRYYEYYRIPNGIGPVYEKTLNALGIVSFAQLAEQDPESLAERMGLQITADRIRRDRWVEQAQAFAEGIAVAQAEKNGG